MYEKFILKPEQRNLKELLMHNSSKEVGTRYVFSDHMNNPEGNIYAIGRVFEKVKESDYFISPHSHKVNSLWLFIGDNPDLSGLKIEIKLNNEIYKLDSPTAVFVPSFLTHSYRPIKGSGKFINITLAKESNYNKSLNIPKGG